MLAFSAVLPALLALGIWQIQRGAEKKQAFAEFVQASSGGARDVTGFTIDAFNALPRYERVELRGRYLVNKQFLLDNMPRHGRPGYHVLTPFISDGADHVVVVDRGWLPGRAAEIDATRLSLHAGATVITGRLAPLPRPALKLGRGSADSTWPRVVQFPDAHELGAALDLPVATPRVLLDPDMPHGYGRDWEPPGITPARHYAYAFQWFALAVMLVVIFVIMARPRRTEESEQ